jgi:hypothetical protein
MTDDWMTSDGTVLGRCGNDSVIGIVVRPTNLEGVRLVVGLRPLAVSHT